jgi:hypothetical protein
MAPTPRRSCETCLRTRRSGPCWPTRSMFSTRASAWLSGSSPLTVVEMATLPLRPQREHDFYVPELQFEFVFDWDAQGRVGEMLFGPGRGRPMQPLRKK